MRSSLIPKSPASQDAATFDTTPSFSIPPASTALSTGKVLQRLSSRHWKPSLIEDDCILLITIWLTGLVVGLCVGGIIASTILAGTAP